MDASGHAEVLVEDLSCCRAAVLHRPAALNAVNANMVARLTELYARWDKHAHVGCILLKGSGDKAFCAGGDVRALARRGGSPQAQAQAVAYFRAEDTLVHRISQLSKPHVAVMDGIVMGGGAGLALNGEFRVATERTLFAMPECVIGFFPDVGATHFLNKLPGRLGLACALTGLRLRGRELRDLGLATHYVESAALPALMRRLDGLPLSAARSSAAVSNALTECESLALLQPPAADSILRALPLIDAWFAGESVEEIDGALGAAAGRAGEGAQLAASLRAELRRGAPTSLKVALEAMRRNRGLSLAECLRAEFRLVVRFMAPEADFFEGVRAALVEKDGRPAWRPAQLAEVTPAAVEAFFEPLQPEWPELELSAADSKL